MTIDFGFAHFSSGNTEESHLFAFTDRYPTLGDPVFNYLDFFGFGSAQRRGPLPPSWVTNYIIFEFMDKYSDSLIDGEQPNPDDLTIDYRVSKLVAYLGIVSNILRTYLFVGIALDKGDVIRFMRQVQYSLNIEISDYAYNKMVESLNDILNDKSKTPSHAITLYGIDGDGKEFHGFGGPEWIGNKHIEDLVDVSKIDDATRPHHPDNDILYNWKYSTEVGVGDHCLETINSLAKVVRSDIPIKEINDIPLKNMHNKIARLYRRNTLLI